jgi:flagellar hook-associated protein 2
MNTTQVIAGLMQVAAQPQTNLKSQVAKENGVISAYQSLNTRMAALRTAAQAFTAPSPLIPTNPTWQSVKATSSSTAVVATASAGAATGTFTFDVTALAKAQLTTARVDPAGPVTLGSGIDLTVGTTTTHVDIATDTDTAQGVADAINGAKLGVTAAVLSTSQGTVLQFTGATGTAHSFSVAGLSAATTDVTTAADAEITVGDPNNGGYTVTSGTNTFANVMPNVTLNVSQLATGVSVNTVSDTDSIADKMQAMVDSANAVLGQIKSQTGYNPATKSGGPLMGDSTLRGIQGATLSAVGNGATGYGDFKQLGIQLNRDGNLTFNRNAFITAYNANPAGVQDAVAGGVAKQFDTITKAATDPISGSLTTAIQGGNDQVRHLNRQISDWNVRLQARQAAYQRQFTHLEVALGKMKDQSSWLSGQIAGLSTSGR